MVLDDGGRVRRARRPRPARTFSPADREDHLGEVGRVCGPLRRASPVADCEFDHIVAWIKGGPTSVENGRAGPPILQPAQGEGRDEIAA